MMRLRLLSGALILFGAQPLRAQSDSPERARGVVAYRAMDYEGAIRWLRQDLDRRKRDLRAEERAELLGYVGAAEHWLGRPDSAAMSFRDALRASPRFRPDTLIFPHAVWVAFEQAREATTFVEAKTVGDSEFKVGQGAAHFRLFASAPHRVRVTMCDEGGGRLRGIHDGWLADSMMVRWDGHFDSGREPASGRVGLCSTGDDGTRVRLLELDLEVRRLAPAVAMGSSANPVATSGGSRTSVPWLGALVGAAAVAIIPTVVSDGERGTPARFAVSAVMLVVALRGAFAQRTPSVTANAPAGAPTGETTIAIRATPSPPVERPDAP